MRPSIAHRLRHTLAALMVGLLVLVSIDPCAAFAQPSPSRPVAQAPADPCDSHHARIVCACAQLSCQHFAVPASGVAVRAPTPSEATFTPALAAALGRTEAPPLPPPRFL